ncbi:MAG TPA: glycogen/starch/alpha-glucan family phosphorylase [Chlamydiales bacterium]|nr:glycogen/starch/alpha-glucan family phosphorylase [Chlamydiales bacterium]
MDDINQKATSLVQKIKHFLISNLGKVETEASNEEFYLALCYALREEIMLHWTSTLHSFDAEKSKYIYYISMEYLPGRFFQNNMTNIKEMEVVKAILKKVDRNLQDILDCDVDPGLGNGGLGRLASCFLDSLATLRYPCFGYGLKYQYGIFEQELWNGVQIERPDCWLLNQNPWEFRKDRHANTIKLGGKIIPSINSYGNDAFLLEDFEEIRALPYDFPIIGYREDGIYPVISMRLWSTKESPRNFALQRFNAGQLGQAGENSALTDVLYPNDNHEIGKRIRLKQEFLLVSASLQDIIKHHMFVHNDIQTLPQYAQIQINDTHPALVIAELTRILVKNFDLPFDQAVEITQNTCNYTNHTVMREALEEWNEHRMFELLPRQYHCIQKLNEKFCHEIRTKYPEDEEKVRRMSFIEDGQIKMANLAIYGSKKVNGVASLHTDILKKNIFKDFAEMYPEKFISITNGITQRRWLLLANPRLAKFLDEKIGPEWITDLPKLEKLKDLAKDPLIQEEFLRIKKENKKEFFEYLSKENPIRDWKGKIVQHSQIASENALVDVQIKRFHEYKRQLMNALHTIILYQELLENPDSRQIERMVVFAGKAAPGYEMAKYIIMLIFAIARKVNEDPKTNAKLKVAFVENYNVSKAQIIIPAADLSQQISKAGLEASGTGNMKLALNGALTIGTEDGANIEMREAVTDKWWPFSFGAKAEEIEEMKTHQTYYPQNIYNNNPKIRNAVHALKDGTFARCKNEHDAFCKIYYSLINGPFDPPGDRYFILHDLDAYYNTQKKVEELYLDQNKWAEYALQNIASMGRFSSDLVIENYAEKIWEITTCKLNEKVHEKVLQDYLEHDRCYIPPKELD